MITLLYYPAIETRLRFSPFNHQKPVLELNGAFVSAATRRAGKVLRKLQTRLLRKANGGYTMCCVMLLYPWLHFVNLKTYFLVHLSVCFKSWNYFWVVLPVISVLVYTLLLPAASTTAASSSPPPVKGITSASSTATNGPTPAISSAIRSSPPKPNPRTASRSNSQVRVLNYLFSKTNAVLNLWTYSSIS